VNAPAARAGGARGVVIANPRAGVAAQAAAAAVQRSGGAWAGLEVRTTRAPGHARELAAEAAAQGHEVVIACGGDGTINEVAWGLLDTNATLGILPAGSGNGLARTLGIPRRPRIALLVLAQSLPRPMDVGFVNGKPFVNIAGVGYDAFVAQAFDEHGKGGGRRGLSGYFRTGLANAFRYEAPEISVEVAGQQWSQRTLLVAFANGRQYGGGAEVAPFALLDDGQIDVATIEFGSVMETLWHVPRMYNRRIEGFRRYRRVLAPAAVLTATAPVPYHRDGEPESPTTRIELSVRRRALKVLVPPARIVDPRGPFTTT
jgi:YegS/Rv2252/BmrU family lipid kinase